MIVLFDIDGVIRDVGGSYRRALADTVEQFTQGRSRPSPAAIDNLKAEGQWNNDWEASRELIYRQFEAAGQTREETALDYAQIVEFFQSKYRGEVPQLDGTIAWTGYICQEPLLAEKAYFDRLTAGGIAWGFFSGATRASANFVLRSRLGLVDPLLIAMEDAPGKPDPTGMFMALEQLGANANQPVFYDWQGAEIATQSGVDRNWRVAAPCTGWGRLANGLYSDSPASRSIDRFAQYPRVDAGVNCDRAEGSAIAIKTWVRASSRSPRPVTLLSTDRSTESPTTPHQRSTLHWVESRRPRRVPHSPARAARSDCADRQLSSWPSLHPNP
jgi:HAD superfamily phosphatase